MFQEPVAPYLITAYAVFLGGMALYFISLKVRQNNTKREEDAIKQIEEEIKNKK
ncbi:MAG TPA: hypothetical protein PLJ62_05755 [Thermoflexales bacterium]|nr:hypothetical protein [Thermoflexales bacterium]HQW34901.1 hypothetical protein [Thermoflexales bacterium]HQX75871.1 hypothetical protein [Thermoflexales bacterium]HQZ22363.1 hypothetical protein [Thermoflexales bacterium]HQZ99679.1 hypothetical protein [Thermoflexales bacterium]